MNGYNFTERVRKVLARAREEAVALRHEYVGTEHILLSLARGGGVAEATLQNLGVDLVDLRQRILDAVKPGPADVEGLGAGPVGILDAIADSIGLGRTPIRGPDLPYTSRAKKVLELAMSEARNLSHSYVGTEHLLLGVIREQQGIAAQILTSLGLTVNGARDEVMRLLGTELPERSTDSEERTRVTDADSEAAITLVIEHADGRIEARKFRRTGDAVTFLNGLEY
jgi:ATP-dependent Clp protease ATP-binding subunit ClpC